MADIFTGQDVKKLFKNKFILFIGDSNIRALYKDMLFLLLNNNVTPANDLLRVPNFKKWNSYLTDRVLNISGDNCKGREYFEIREYKSNHVHIQFHFVTKINAGDSFRGRDIKQSLTAIQLKKIPVPDIIIMNTGTWDLTRWGPNREDEYKKDLMVLFSDMRKTLPDDTLIIWTSLLPISINCTKGGFLVKQLEFIRYSYRFAVMEANKYTRHLCVALGIDFLDLHFYMRFQLHRRSIDGIHWETQATRYMNCIILTHIALALDFPLPDRVNNNSLKLCIQMSQEEADPISNMKNFDVETKKLIEGSLKDIEHKSPGLKPGVSELTKKTSITLKGNKRVLSTCKSLQNNYNQNNAGNSTISMTSEKTIVPRKLNTSVKGPGKAPKSANNLGSSGSKVSKTNIPFNKGNVQSSKASKRKGNNNNLTGSNPSTSGFGNISPLTAENNGMECLSNTNQLPPLIPNERVKLSAFRRLSAAAQNQSNSNFNCNYGINFNDQNFSNQNCDFSHSSHQNFNNFSYHNFTNFCNRNFTNYSHVFNQPASLHNYSNSFNFPFSFPNRNQPDLQIFQDEFWRLYNSK